MNLDEFERLFETFEWSAFRLETLQQYVVEEEADELRTFREGRLLPRRTPENDSWLRGIADSTAVGQRWYRVHVVDRPLSEYVRFELAGYVDNVAAGEKIYLANRDAHPDLDELREDFWLFDDRVLVVMQYDREGRFLGLERGDEEQLEAYRRRRDLALRHALPLHRYLKVEGLRLTA